MVQETLIPDVIRDAVTLACRAPSLHNSQPWRWVADGQLLHLFADASRVMLAADSVGREITLSCGVALDHVQVALAAAGWNSTIERFPDRHDPQHLAVIRFSPTETVTDDHCKRADAILRRRTDRLPFAAPTDWPSLQSALRQAILKHHVMFDAVLDDARAQLAEASRLTETLRHYDPSYQAELRWWASPFEHDEGIPQRALVSAAEAARVDVSRMFPPAGGANRRPQVGVDQSKIVVLSSIHEDERLEVLRCGEALSTVLLECTVAGMATCTLTHMIEVEPSRDIVRKLIGQAGLPQVLVRIGTAPESGEQPAATPRRPITDVLEFRR
jgi:nitroreductase